MSPEAIQTPDLVDARSDLYAVGAIGYFLLTGQPVFNATLARRAVPAARRQPCPMRRRSGWGGRSPPELESAILACLEKSRAKRPQTARDLAALLDRAPTASSWSLDDAEAWWGRHERARAAGAAASSTQGTSAPGSSTPGSGAQGAGEPAPSGPAATGASGQASAVPLGTRTAASGFDQTIASGHPTS